MFTRNLAHKFLVSLARSRRCRFTLNMVQKTIFTSNYFHVNRINFFLMCVNQGLDTSKSVQGLDKSKSAAYGYRGATRHVVATWQGRGSPSRCHLPGYKPFLRLSVGKFLTTPIQPVPIPSTGFFFPFRFTVFVTTAHTLTHLRPGP